MPRTLLAAALVAALATPALAQSPAAEQIPYQGRLTDAAGAPLADGAQTIQFTLADGAGGAWTETAAVQTVGGVFTHYLGSVDAIAGVDFAQAPTLSLVLDPGGAATAFGPVPLGAVPTAYRALGGGGTLTFPLSGSASTDNLGATLTLSNTGEGDGLRIETAGEDGVRVFDAGDDGVHIESAGDNGLVIESAGDDGFGVFSAGEDGVYVGSAGDNGVHVWSAGSDGVYVDVSGDDGLGVGYAGEEGFRVYRAGSRGFSVGTAGDTDDDGIPDVEADGVYIGRAGGDGVQVTEADRTGVFVESAGIYGVDGRGALGGGYFRAGVSGQVYAPDVILGGAGSGSSGRDDDGVLQSDFSYAGSDIHLRSNDAVSVFLDVNNDEDGDFNIVNGTLDIVWSVNEAGTVFTSGLAVAGETAVYLDDPSAPDARTLTLPAAVSSERLVAFSGNATTDASGAATVRLPDYADALAGDFRYQLTAVGSFAQAIVGQKVEGGRFVIRTSEPSVEVSWRVEGVRQDAWAAANVHTAVAAKAEAGLYVHPEAFGQSPEAALARVVDAPSQLTEAGRQRLADEEVQAQRDAAERAEDERQRAEEQRQREAETRERDAERPRGALRPGRN